MLCLPFGEDQIKPIRLKLTSAFLLPSESVLTFPCPLYDNPLKLGTGKGFEPPALLPQGLQPQGHQGRAA